MALASLRYLNEVAAEVAPDSSITTYAFSFFQLDDVPIGKVVLVKDDLPLERLCSALTRRFRAMPPPRRSARRMHEPHHQSDWPR